MLDSGHVTYFGFLVSNNESGDSSKEQGNEDHNQSNETSCASSSTSGSDNKQLRTVIGLNDSPVAGFLEALSPGELLLEQVKVLLLDGINASEHVPVNVGVTWRGGHRALVDPSLGGVNHVHQVSVGHFSNSGVGVSLGPSQRVKEVVDDFLLPGLHVDVVVIHGEDNSQGSVLHALSLAISWQMDGVHFDIVSLSIHCVL